MTTTPLHVAILGHTAALSGGELALVRMLPHLRAEDLRLTVVLAEDGPAVQAVRDTGVDVVVLPLSASVRHRSRAESGSLRTLVGAALPTVRHLTTLRRWLRDNQVDLVHTNTLKAAVYGGLAGRAARLPVLWHIRDRIADDYLPRRTVQLIHALSRVLPRRVAVNSAATAATLPAALQDRVQVVPDCVDPPVAARSRPLGQRTGDSAVTIGMMGRLSPWKGQDVVIEAFAQAFADDARTRLVFVGSAMFGEHGYEEQLRRRVGELGLCERVLFRGFQSDVWEEYAGFDVAVHASVVAEPFGQVVIEAMAAGVPVVAADAGGPTEVITDGQDGLLVPPRDVGALARALTRLVRQPELRRELGRRGRKTADRYGPAATVAALRESYATLAPHWRRQQAH